MNLITELVTVAVTTITSGLAAAAVGLAAGALLDRARARLRGRQ